MKFALAASSLALVAGASARSITFTYTYVTGLLSTLAPELRPAKPLAGRRTLVTPSPSMFPTTGCSTADCPVDLNANCPAELQGPSGASGNEGCKSACFANLDGNPTDSANCCSGSHATQATCPSSGVTDYSYFKNACPNSYCYAYDEASGTALWTCDAGKAASYTVTFCP
ncbi:hypothetical protein SERLA73DRAFT_160383 [Serpula lacrymans var. lacrymans S7.3]|uniref:Thaumatin-like protein n=1 Tax=Serpula lacrymans var. lacrymans (strain S7.3) TaxID=936435 RepID=F8PXQ2_SERL3|nr:hypothetical protein SERLA73DRAFT_160383 [Serpula lacrymans var. lacrymans S7.3]